MPDTENTTTTTNVDSVAVRPPPFYDSNPALWFGLLEGQFAANRISSDAVKYGSVLSALTVSQSTEVMDIITEPPATDKYKTIKDALISRLSTSNAKRLEQLIDREELGDRKPSQLLRRLRQLAGTSVTDDALKTLWMRRLPNDTQKILKASREQLNTLADIADEIHDTYQSAHVSAVSTETEALRKQIDALTKQIAQLSSNRSRDHSRSRSQRRGRSNSRNREDNGQCWYHNRFGNKATKCTKPCNYNEGNANGNQ
ncbi:uncharacterized protein LOC128956847 [Oppia nitens]|uniref:uncharacterized protein LOC128956847 n=1 Tax=Oppia nitens TaxID=1686743 RepID=UPI0023D9C6C5|nr:uncharacterized protein LOC128956847 [Oppia nitens]